MAFTEGEEIKMAIQLFQKTCAFGRGQGSHDCYSKKLKKKRKEKKGLALVRKGNDLSWGF